MSHVSADFFKPFVVGTLETIRVQCGIETSPGKPFIKGNETQPDFEIAGVIGLTSEAFAGNITICFPGKVFLQIMSSMLGEQYTEITPELQDGAAELLNIIFGTAKAALNQQGHTIQMAIPTVIRGSALQTSALGIKKAMVLPFHTPAGEFHVEISMDSGTKK